MWLQTLDIIVTEFFEKFCHHSHTSLLVFWRPFRALFLENINLKTPPMFFLLFPPPKLYVQHQL